MRTFTVFEDDKPPSDKTCNSTGCAIGYCPAVFPKLCHYGDGSDTDVDTNISEPSTKCHGDSKNVIMSGNKSIENFGVAERLFDISLDDTKYLFMYTAYHKSHRGPKSVANRIRSYIKSYGDINKQSKAYNLEYV